MQTLYTTIGPHKLQQLVDNFYDLVLGDSKIKHLFDLENTQIREKQYKFLTQFLGGPQLYTEEYGHPKMRARHAPHAIDNDAKDEWLRCMRLAIDQTGFEKELGDALYNCFPAVAQHMVNR